MTEEEAIAISPIFYPGANPHQCRGIKTMKAGSAFTPRQCRKRPSVFVGRLGFCRFHDPFALSTRYQEARKAQQAKTEETALLTEAEVRERAVEKACAQAVRTIAAGGRVSARVLCQNIVEIAQKAGVWK